MLSNITISNFKAFAESQRIPIRPITLIYGANSSGKSSIIHSLLYARHAFEKGDLDVHRTEVGGDSVDLGGFRQFIHRRNPNNRFVWTAEIDATQIKEKKSSSIFSQVKTVSVTVALGIALDDEGRPLPDKAPEVESYEMRVDEVSIMRMSKRHDDTMKIDRLEHEHPILQEVIKAIIQSQTTTESVSQQDIEDLTTVIDEIIPEIIVARGKFLPEGIVRNEKEETGIIIFPVSKGNRKDDLAKAVRAWLPPQIDNMIKLVNGSILNEMMRLQYLGPLRSYPQRHLAFAQQNDSNWFAGGGYAWDVIRKDTAVREKVNLWLSDETRLQTPYELSIRKFISPDMSINEIWAALEEIAKEMAPDLEKDSVGDSGFGGGTASGAGFEDGSGSGELLEYKFKSIFHSRWDPDIFSKYITDHLTHQSGPDVFSELVLTDRRTQTSVSHRDVGVGISQVLPVLVSAFASKEKIIAIEQPEIHLHPALQADLGDVFIESALGEQKNIFLLESHSEHLVLRILRRIRETNEGTLLDALRPITPNDVTIIYVDPTSKGSQIIEIPITAEGEFALPWPRGFFPERMKELF